MQERLEEEAPGAVYSFSQPIQMRMQELMEAEREAILRSSYIGDDLSLCAKADQIAAVVSKDPGSRRCPRGTRVPDFLTFASTFAEMPSPAMASMNPMCSTRSRRLAANLSGEIVEGNRRFTLQVRFPLDERETADAIGNLRVGDNEGHFIPLAQLADIEDEEGPAQISRENGQRRINVEVNVRGRDLASFVADAQKAVAAKVVHSKRISSLHGAANSNSLQSASQRL